MPEGEFRPSAVNIVLTLSRISGKHKDVNLPVDFSSLLFLVTFFSNYVLLSRGLNGKV